VDPQSLEMAPTWRRPLGPILYNEGTIRELTTWRCT
jgi:hypothetical protein